MIFACDLDQTLIYSRNSMGPVDAEQLVPVERIDGQYHSFMTRTAYENLQELSERLLFVPATTRITEQYRRIFGLTEGVRYRYAIVSNGGQVFIDGKPDLDWESSVRRTVRTNCAESLEIKQAFDRLVSEECVVKSSYCDDLFYSIVVNRDLLPPNLMAELATMLTGLGWSCSLQGRKIYLVPDHVTKGAAVQYVKELSGALSVFAAGDSLLDESMLTIADEAMAPKHGELFRKYGNHDRIRFTERSGIRASEEILEYLTNRMEVRSAL
ncbi:hydrolase [Cohnella lupini]|uniref:Hydroxymethylpyrimidine pyrophosphatase-like HAD family hydrolase n=1 Tax=Cohnella lupini TaxID=1294267 RepID=A0A3D9IN49_9BACL|nr:hydrolase [Cohnella lupini]RED63155.1 hydroxymethylpyrimidine pyrophosphatase-like HAD family hydrolase [Cohnella lupini]